jgi:hypothetical protein
MNLIGLRKFEKRNRDNLAKIKQRVQAFAFASSKSRSANNTNNILIHQRNSSRPNQKVTTAITGGVNNPNVNHTLNF